MTKARNPAIFEVELDVGTADTPHRSRRLYQQLKAAILGGQLKPGIRLPSSRVSAASFGMARTTVVGVYDQLLDEGYLVARHGSGTYVADRAPAPPEAAPPMVEAPDPRLNAYWFRGEVRSAFGFFEDRPAESDEFADYPEGHDFRPAWSIWSISRSTCCVASRPRSCAPSSGRRSTMAIPRAIPICARRSRCIFR